MARRENSSRRRRTPSRISASRVLAVCCGQTEQAYLDGLKRLSKPVTVKTMVKVGSPVQLVKYAAKVRENDRGGFDEYWCVVDVDEFDISDAIAEAGATGISMAVSNPCFEVWLILHFADCARPASPVRKRLPRSCASTCPATRRARSTSPRSQNASTRRSSGPRRWARVTRRVTCGALSRSFGSTEFKRSYLGRLR